MTTNFTPSTSKARPYSRSIDGRRFRPGQRVLYRPTDNGEPKIGEITAHTDMSGNWFTIGTDVVCSLNIEGEVRAGADEAAMLRDFARSGRSKMPMDERRRLRAIHKLA